MLATVKAVSNYEALKDIVVLPKSFKGKNLELIISPLKPKQDKRKFFSACGKIHLDPNEVIANRELSKI